MRGSGGLIETAERHLTRVAFHTRDNPYLRAAAITDLSAHERRTLQSLLDSDGEAETLWNQESLIEAVGEVQLGAVPRDLQLLLRDEQYRVGVETVYAFARAPRFWWLVSYLWCLEAGRLLDRRLPETILGARFHPDFRQRPRSTGQMFRRAPRPSAAWGRIANAASATADGAVVAATTIDLRSFYYSVDAAPTAIIRIFARTQDRRLRLSRRGQTLSELLDVAHATYADADQRVAPRGDAMTGGARPLPAGFPSSQVLANLVVASVTSDLGQLPLVQAVGAYVDDILVVSATLPEVGEKPIEYLARLDVINNTQGEEPHVRSAAGSDLAGLTIATEKIGISYGRAATEGGSEDEETSGSSASDDLFAVPPVDPYFDGPSEPDWAGKLRTVLHSPFKRERLPRELLSDLRILTDQIRVGIDAAEAADRFTRLLDGLDRATVLELRPYWTELLACAEHIDPPNALTGVLALIDAAIEGLETNSPANQDLAAAVESGLRFSLAQALAEALAAARGIAATDQTVLTQGTGQSGAQLTDQIRRVRRSRFILADLVSTPLSEFTDWEGPLFGASNSVAFERWARESADGASANAVAAGVRQAARFIALHEACLAVHLWVRPEKRGWLGPLFEILRAQTLLDQSAAADLKRRVKGVLGEGTTGHLRAELADYRFRFAVPSLAVNDDQLRARLAGDVQALSRISRLARQSVRSLVRSAASRHADVLVFPEWSLPARQLAWTFQEAARAQMLIVGGEAPRVRGGQYSNRIWTGIPITDSGGRRVCLVPPPREKRYLSDDEKRLLLQYGVAHVPAPNRVPVYAWRGICIASLVCFEFADINARDALRSKADLLVVSSLNRDWRYFNAIQEATTRDNYCISVCVNTSKYPGSHIMRPTRSDRAIALSVHGSEQPAIVTRLIDLLPIVVARASQTRPKASNGFLPPADDLELADYRALPPAF